MSIRLNVEWNTGGGASEAKVYKMYEGDTTKTAVTLPSEVIGSNTLPVFATFNDRLYIAGTFSNILRFDEYEDLKTAGIEAPGTGASITASGSGTLTGTMIPYITFADIADNGDVLAESNPAIGDAVDFSSAASRVWADIPSSGPERATHVRGYVSALGGLPRLAWTRIIGTTAVTEGMTTAFLAQQPALPNDGESVVLNRLPPPNCKYIFRAKRRMFYAGSQDRPSRVWWSEIDEPEAVGANSWEETRDGEHVTGIGRWNDQIIIFCDGATYELQGWTDGSDGIPPDLRLNKLITGPGCISHHSIVDINDRLWYADKDGVRIYDGGFRYVSKTIRTAWRTDFNANESSYFRAQAVDDKFYNCYMLLIPKSSAFYWIGHYLVTDPAMGGAGRDPWWTNDKRSRKDESLGLYKNADGSRDIVVGGCDGYIRKEDASDTDDDGDTLAKQITLSLHRAFGDAGHDVEGGKTILDVFSIVESETYPFNLSLYAGDESALDQTLAEARTEAVGARADAGNVADDVWNHNFESLSGRNFAFKWTTNTTDGVDTSFKFRGFGCTVQLQGPAKRGASS